MPRNLLIQLNNLTRCGATNQERSTFLEQIENLEEIAEFVLPLLLRNPKRSKLDSSLCGSSKARFIRTKSKKIAPVLKQILKDKAEYPFVLTEV